MGCTVIVPTFSALACQPGLGFDWLHPISPPNESHGLESACFSHIFHIFKHDLTACTLRQAVRSCLELDLRR